MTLIDWPKEVLPHVESSLFINWLDRSLGVSIIDREQVISPGVGTWEVSMQILRTSDQTVLKTFEALTAQMRGRYGSARFDIRDLYRYSASISPLQETFDDGTWFSDGTGIIREGVQPMVVTADAAIGDTSLSVSLTNPLQPPFRIGDLFSHDDFLHRVTSTAGTTVNFLPRLRSAISNGAVLQTDPPKFRAKFADREQGRRSRQYLRHASPVTLTFVEDLDR